MESEDEKAEDDEEVVDREEVEEEDPVVGRGLEKSVAKPGVTEAELSGHEEAPRSPGGWPQFEPEPPSNELSLHVDELLPPDSEEALDDETRDAFTA